MIKKALSIVLVSLLMMSVFAGCSTPAPAASASDTSTATSTPTQDIPNIVFAYGSGNAIKTEHVERVQKLVSDYCVEKIGCTVTLMPIMFADWSQKMSLTLATPSEQIDVMAALYAWYPTYLAQGQLTDMTSLVDQYYPEYEEEFGSLVLECGMNQGKVYGLPAITATATSRGLNFNKDLVDEFDIDLDSIHSLEDLTPIFAMLKEAKPDLYPYGMDGSTISALFAMEEYDALDNDLGALFNCTTNTTVVNPYASEEYAAYCKLVREWYEAGYVNPECLTSTTFVEYDVQDGIAFVSLTSNNAVRTSHEEDRGTYYRMLYAPVNTTACIGYSRVCIPNNSKYPEKAMQFIKLLFEDQELLDLVTWGEKDVDYTLNDDGLVFYPEDVDMENIYVYGAAFMIGSEYVGTPIYYYPVDYKEELRAFNESAVDSLAVGFSFDTTSVATEISAVQTVTAEYTGALQCGLVDPEVMLPEFLAKLEAAGIDTIIAEKQRQLDEWLASK